MAEKRIEYRFVLDAYTPDTIPMSRLAQYMADLAALYGEVTAVHFVRLEESSTAIVSAVDADGEAGVSERLAAVRVSEGPDDARRAAQSLHARVAEDRGTAYLLNPSGAKILEFKRPEPVEPEVYGPFWQTGHLIGRVIGSGGKGDPVSVRLLIDDETLTCRAKLDVARRLLAHQWGGPIRVNGRGRWFRAPDGVWELDGFEIHDFVELSDESLAETILRLQAIEGRWKNRPDPLQELEELRHGDDRVQ